MGEASSFAAMTYSAHMPTGTSKPSLFGLSNRRANSRACNALSILMALLLAAVAFPASAGVVYLDCELENYGFKVTLDESQGTAVITDGIPYSGKAEFSPDKVVFSALDRYGAVSFRKRWTISRVDLSADYIWISYTNSVETKRITESGKCRQVKPPERKF